MKPKKTRFFFTKQWWADLSTNFFGALLGIVVTFGTINTTFLPFFQENGEKWIMTTPYFQVALKRDLTQDETRRKKAMKVLDTMLSEDAQNRGRRCRPDDRQR